ncbi:hypothetical protein [Streptomyces sp. UNOC14_S4]|uniref:hypothetical protein n=1 Tax=Streptomyces sp. UNOC14_S4 TaxID=2872340 RepID=UPI001E291A94|nr:hypothetical protein [Streptomyces sp. UNOC14_S4]MCC3767514.1 hypothetical protein [Streptomyces sp. UNOC14_S4]
MSKRVIALAAVAAALAGTAIAPGADAAGVPAGADVRVGSTAVGTVSPTAIGANMPFWNPHLTRPDTAELIRKAGIRTLSFNAGPAGDLYHFGNGGWLSPDPGGPGNGGFENLTPRFTFDQFARTAQAAHAGMLVHVNYGTGPTDTKDAPSTPENPKPGDPQEAAAWVRYANRTHHYGVRDWVIGEETYLNGWHPRPPGMYVEPDAHPDRTPAAYARNSIEYAKAMKAVDPAIRIGIELAPYDPAGTDRPGIDRNAKLWDDGVLGTPGLADAVDFVDIHWYHAARAGSDAGVLADTAAIGPTLRALRTDLDRASGPRHRLDIVAGETNSGAATATRQQTGAVGALHLIDNNLTLLENGATAVDWWALYNGPNSTPDGGWGDLGLLSSGGCPSDQPGRTDCEPPAGTPFAPYWTMQLLTTALKGGGTLLSTTATGSSTLAAHAIRRADGTLAVVVVNKDPQHAQGVRLSVPRGYRADRTVTWRQGDTSPTTRSGPAPTTLAPYSAAVVLFQRTR